MIWDIEEIIKQARQRVEQGEENAVRKRKGFTIYVAFDFGTGEPLEKEFKEMTRWGDGGFRRVWIDPTRWAIFTYCEGDITLEKYDTLKDFLKGLGVSVMYYDLDQDVED